MTPWESAIKAAAKASCKAQEDDWNREGGRDKLLPVYRAQVEPAIRAFLAEAEKCGYTLVLKEPPWRDAK
jgi:hypothetical protein